MKDSENLTTADNLLRCNTSRSTTILSHCGYMFFMSPKKLILLYFWVSYKFPNGDYKKMKQKNWRVEIIEWDAITFSRFRK